MIRQRLFLRYPIGVCACVALSWHVASHVDDVKMWALPILDVMICLISGVAWAKAYGANNEPR